MLATLKMYPAMDNTAVSVHPPNRDVSVGFSLTVLTDHKTTRGPLKQSNSLYNVFIVLIALTEKK